MTRRAPWGFLALFLVALPFAIIGIACNDTAGPVLQSVSKIDSKAAADVKEDKIEPASPDETKIALERLDAAIKAHGGEAALKKLGTSIQKLRGSIMTFQWGMIEAYQEFNQQFPDRMRLTVKATTAQGPMNITIGIDRGNTWLVDGPAVRNIPEAVNGSVLEELYYHRVIALFPLKEPEFVLRPIPGEQVNKRPTNAIRVGSKGHRAVNLFFDAETGLLVRTYHETWVEGEAVQQRDVLYSEHKPFEEAKLPTRLIDYRDGKRWVDCTAEYKFVPSFDPKEFERPKG